MDWDIIQLWIIQFVNRWVKSGKTNEKSHGQGFVIEFLKAFGIDWLAAPDSGMETKVFDGYSDYIWFGRIIIEPGFPRLITMNANKVIFYSCLRRFCLLVMS